MKKLGYLLFLILIAVVLCCFVGCEFFNSKEPEIVDVDHQVDSKTWLQLMDSKNEIYKDCTVSGYAYDPDKEEYLFLKACIDGSNLSFAAKLINKDNVNGIINNDDIELKTTIVDTITDIAYLETNIGLWIKESNYYNYGFSTALDILRGHQQYYSSFTYNAETKSYRRADSEYIYELAFNNKKLVTYRELNLSGDIELVRVDFSYDATITIPTDIYNAEDYLEYDNTEIGLYVKANKQAGTLTKIALPEFVEVLDKDSFSYCNSLKTLKLPKSLKILEKDTIPNTVETIEYDGKKAELASKIITLDKDITITCTDGDFQPIETIDGIKYQIKDGSYSVVGIDPALVIADIKEKVNGVSVTNIEYLDEGGFVCRMLSRIVIPSTITSIKKDLFMYSTKLVEVCNLSSLNIEMGSKDNGYVGYYAKDIYTANGTTKIATEDNYVKYKGGNETILLGYVGDDKDLVLPNDITSVRGCIADNIDSIEITSDLECEIDWSEENFSNLITDIIFFDGISSTAAIEYFSNGMSNITYDIFVDTLATIESYYKLGTSIGLGVRIFVEDTLVIPENILNFEFMDDSYSYTSKGATTHNGIGYIEYECTYINSNA